MSIVNPDVLGRLANGRALWVGDFPPRSDMIDGRSVLDSRADFRLGPELHQSFDLVFLTEPDLGAIKQWPMVLDEAMRAVKPGGVVVVRLIQSAFLSIFKLANYIEKWTHGDFRLLDQTQDDDRYILTLQLTHSRSRPAQANDFTFGLVTDGRKPAAVAAFVRSILALQRPEGAAEPEILLCGPDSILKDLGACVAAVTLIAQPEAFQASGWITRKKNLLVSAAARENVLIAHDRYVVPEDFYQRVADFGGDFGVIVPRQLTHTGVPVPDWVMVAEDLNWSTPGWLEFGDYHPHAFINGGVMIAKRNVLTRTPWSELLMWGQAEDVELSRRLADAGVTPRTAGQVVVRTDPPRASFTEGFERLPWADACYPVTERPVWRNAALLGPSALSPSPAPRLAPESTVSLANRTIGEIAAGSGVVFGRDWVSSSRGLIWTGEGRPWFSLKSHSIAAELLLRLTLDVESGPVSCVRVNDRATHAYASPKNRVEVLIDSGTITNANIMHVALDTSGREPLVLSALEISRELAARLVQPGSGLGFGRREAGCALLGDGWNDPGEREVEATGSKARLVLAFARTLHNALPAAITLRRLDGCPDASKVVLRADSKILAIISVGEPGKTITADFDIPAAPARRTVELSFELPETPHAIALCSLRIGKY